MDFNEKWLSVKEVSGVLGWSVDTIRRLIDKGHMKAIVLPCNSASREPPLERRSKRRRDGIRQGTEV
jgi:hypothetical protein